MRRFVVPAAITAVVIVLLVVLAVGITNSGSNNSIAYSVQSGQYKLPPNDDTPLPGLSGNAAASSTLASLRGKLVLVNYFASWCEPCQQEAPILKQADKMLQAKGGTVLGIVFNEGPSAAQGYLRQYGLTYPTVLDPSDDVAHSWGISQIPDSYLLDRQGKIVYLNTYQLTSSFLSSTLPGLIRQFA